MVVEKYFYLSKLPPSSKGKTTNFKYYYDIFHYKIVKKCWLPGSWSSASVSVYSHEEISSAFKRSYLIQNLFSSSETQKHFMELFFFFGK